MWFSVPRCVTSSLWLYRIKTAGKEILNQRLCCMHPNIIQLHEVFLTPEHLGIVSEYAPGGDLVDYIERHNMAYDRALMESEARWLFQQLIVAVDYCHQVSTLCKREAFQLCSTFAFDCSCTFCPTLTTVSPLTECHAKHVGHAFVAAYLKVRIRCVRMQPI